MSIAEDIVSKEFGRDPKVIGYAVLDSQGNVQLNKKIKDSVLVALAPGIKMLEEHLSSGFLQLKDERIMIVRTDASTVLVSFHMNVQIGFIVMMINKIRSRLLQSVAAKPGLETKGKPVIPKKVEPVAIDTKASGAAQVNPSIPPLPSTAKILEDRQSIGSAESKAAPASFIPPPPASAKVQMLIETSQETSERRPKTTPAASTFSIPAEVEDLVAQLGDPVLSPPTPSSGEPSPVETGTPVVAQKSEGRPAPAEVTPFVTKEAPVEVGSPHEQIPIPTEKFMNLWDEFVTSVLNKKFGEVALEVLSQVDGISRLSTIESRLPHLDGKQVLLVMQQAASDGYINL